VTCGEWFASSPATAAHPLPTVRMIAGQFHTPGDWTRVATRLDDGTAFAMRARRKGTGAGLVVPVGLSTKTPNRVNGYPPETRLYHLTKDVYPVYDRGLRCQTRCGRTGACRLRRWAVPARVD